MQKIPLDIWVMPNTGFSTRSVLLSEIREFQKYNPHYDIHITIHPWSKTWDALMAIVKQRRTVVPPDIIQIGSTWSSTLAYLGVLKNISDSFTLKTRKTFINYALESSFYPGTEQLYSIPWFIDVRVLYFRKDLLALINREKSDLDTWEGFKDVCMALKEHITKKKDIYPLCFSGQKAGILVHDLAPWIWGAGGDFVSSDGTCSLFSKPDALCGIQWYFDLINEGIIPLTHTGGIMPPGSFFTGEYAMQFSGIWPLSLLTNKTDPDYNSTVSKQYGVTFFPRGKKGRYTFFGGSHLAVTSFSRYPAESIEFIRFLISYESQKRHGQASGMFPGVQDAFNDMAEIHPEVGQVFKESLACARLLPSILTLGTIEQIFRNTTEHIVALIQKKEYSSGVLKTEIERASREADYILSLYET